MLSLDLHLSVSHALAVLVARWVRMCGCGMQDVALIFQHEAHAEGFAAAHYPRARVKTRPGKQDTCNHT